VIATGKLTTYPGRSNYQIVIERMEVAGEGALLALLAKTKARLAAEGLFAARKRPAVPAARDRRGHIAHRRGDPRHSAPPGRPLPQPRDGLAGAGAGPGRGGTGGGGGARLFTRCRRAGRSRAPIWSSSRAAAARSRTCGPSTRKWSCARSPNARFPSSPPWATRPTPRCADFAADVRAPTPPPPPRSRCRCART
jgi:hypothetical protein